MKSISNILERILQIDFGKFPYEINSFHFSKLPIERFASSGNSITIEFVVFLNSGYLFVSIPMKFKIKLITLIFAHEEYFLVLANNN